jgi:hypothetical protein
MQIKLATQTIIGLMVAVFMAGCTKKPVIEGYRVMSFDSTTGTYIILRNGTFDGKYLTKRITAVCQFYKWGSRETVNGPNVCALKVGSTLVPRFDTNGKDRVTSLLIVFEDPGFLSVVEGTGEDRVLQGFTILKDEVVSEYAVKLMRWIKGRRLATFFVHTPNSVPL